MINHIFKWRLVFQIFMIVFLLIVPTSCGLYLANSANMTQVPRNKWLVDWLENPVCKPPCFYEITPGESTITDTIQILQTIDGIKILRYPITRFDGEHQEMTWDFTTSTNDDGGRLISDLSGVVSIIIVGPGSDQFLTVAEVLDSFGAPDTVYLTDCRGDRCETQLIYMNSGMVVDMLLKVKGGEPGEYSVEIKPDSIIEVMWFFPPGADGYRAAFGFWADYRLESETDWNGFGVYTEK